MKSPGKSSWRLTMLAALWLIVALFLPQAFAFSATSPGPRIDDGVYLNPDTGRFWSMDSYEGDNESPLSQHKYLYCQANPENQIDPLGHWASIPGFPVHQMAIDQELSFLPESDKSVLRDEQVKVDNHQDASDSYMHAVRDGDHWQTISEANSMANYFVKHHIFYARLAQARGDRPKAMSELGQAMHTLQDSTSPMHHGFQRWYNYFGGAFNPNEWIHGAGEAVNPGPGSWLYKATRIAYDYFNDKAPMPADAFDKLGGDHIIDEAVGAAKRMAKSATQYQPPSIMFEMSVYSSFGY